MLYQQLHSTQLQDFAMQINKNIEVSIKCRIGIGKNFNYDYFEEFIDINLQYLIEIPRLLF